MAAPAAVPKSGEVYYAEDGTVSIVLEDNYDPNYDPPDKEVIEYAKWLGIDTDNEKELLWIAREGLKAPLPKEWKPCKTDTGDVYYFNFKSGESIWDHPMDEIYKKKVEDERGKLREKGGKPAKLVKGGAGSVSSVPDAKAKGRAALEEVRPKSGRLGAIGTSQEQKTVRPDISGLIPTKQEQAVTTLLGKKKEPLKDMKEMERNFRKRYDVEFEATRNTLKEKHDRLLTDLKTQLSSEMRKAVNALQQDVEDEVEQAKRNGERRNKRELQLYEESLDKQKEDLRRSIKTANEKLEADTIGVNRRVESELTEFRATTERNMAADIGRRRQELQEAWQREKTQTELETQSKIRDLRSGHEIKVEQIRQRESQGLLSRVQALEDQLIHEIASVKQSIQQEKASHSERLRQQASAVSEGANAAYTLANTQYQQAIDEARRQADMAAQLERQAGTAAMDSLVAEFTRKTSEAQREASSQSERSSADAVAARRSFVEKRVADTASELAQRLAAEKQKFDEESQRLIAEAQSHALMNAQQKSAALKASAEHALLHAQEQRRVSLAAAEEAHNQRVSAIRSQVASSAPGRSVTNPRDTAEFRSALEQRKQQWLLSNPSPIYHLPAFAPVPTFDPSAASVPPIIVRKEVEDPPTAEEIMKVTEQEVVSAKQQLKLETDRKLQELKLSMSASFGAEYDEHRRKAMSDMEQRLQAYRSSGGSPMRASRARVSAAANANATRPGPPATVVAPTPAPSTDTIPHSEAQKKIDDLRRVLQVRLDDLVTQLSAEAAIAQANAASAQAELQQTASMVTAAAASVPSTAVSLSASGLHIPPRPMSASGFLPRAQTADSAYFSTKDSMPRHGTPTLLRETSAGVVGHQPTPVKMRGQHRTSTFEERLAKAHELLHRKKKDIKMRQKQLEDIRADWKRDMSAAKSSRDEEQIRTLKRVAEVLEMDARQLNKEALAIKESYHWLKHEGETYYYNQQQQGTNSGGPSSPRGGHRSRHAAGDTGDELGALIAGILDRASQVEQQVAVAEEHAYQRSPPRHQGTGDEMYSKWNSWLKKQPTAGPHSKSAETSDDRVIMQTMVPSTSAAVPVQGAGGVNVGSPKKHQNVEQWVKEQQRSSR